MSPAVQLPLDLGHRPALGEADFLVSACNAEAVAWLDRWPDWPGPVLTVFGPAACGKSHLANVWRARSGALVLAPDAPIEPQALVERGNAFVIDAGDADRIDERGLMHLYNLLVERGGHLLLVTRMPPARRRFGLSDLASRLRAAPAVAVGPPDDELIAAVLVKLFADRQLSVGTDVVRYLQTHMERSLAAARRVVAALDEAGLVAHRRITVPLARQVLTDLTERSD